ncbi:hypothetical protein EHF_0249 [Ehrlichia japonica]|uniref:Uncharacterized protein n=1 Tax=Ehrlichia japonica TaxID=391036 RepID=X5GK37_9RICK|nr:hypothetical protein EHF_0249 [Ehrlichia japonica]
MFVFLVVIRVNCNVKNCIYETGSVCIKVTYNVSLILKLHNEYM